jgi:hypothetical protein
MEKTGIQADDLFDWTGFGYAKEGLFQLSDSIPSL